MEEIPEPQFTPPVPVYVHVPHATAPEFPSTEPSQPLNAYIPIFHAVPTPQTPNKKETLIGRQQQASQV